MLLYDRKIVGASSEIFGDLRNLRKSSEIFGNLRKISEKCSETFASPSEQFWKIFGKWSEILGKTSKTSSLVCICNKQNITCPLVDMNFIFSCSTRHLNRSLRSLVRCRVEHTGWEVRMGKNCARGRPRAVLKTRGTVFSHTDRPSPVNNMFFFFLQ